jgi:hypothetical protein
MKTSLLFLPAALVSFVLFTGAARADIFATNAAIGALDTNYEGADIVISNCTVTVDGAHSFASLFITNGGVLTHSFFSNGTSSIIFNVTNEPQILSSTNPATLLNTNVSLPLVVTDLSGDTTYTNNVDYVVVPQPDGTTQIQWTNTSSIADGATVLVSYSWIYVVQAGLASMPTATVMPRAWAAEPVLLPPAVLRTAPARVTAATAATVPATRLAVCATARSLNPPASAAGAARVTRAAAATAAA